MNLSKYLDRVVRDISILQTSNSCYYLLSGDDPSKVWGGTPITFYSVNGERLFHIYKGNLFLWLRERIRNFSDLFFRCFIIGTFRSCLTGVYEGFSLRGPDGIVLSGPHRRSLTDTLHLVTFQLWPVKVVCPEHQPGSPTWLDDNRVDLCNPKWVSTSLSVHR